MVEENYISLSFIGHRKLICYFLYSSFVLQLFPAPFLRPRCDCCCHLHLSGPRYTHNMYGPTFDPSPLRRCSSIRPCALPVTGQISHSNFAFSSIVRSFPFNSIQSELVQGLCFQSTSFTIFSFLESPLITSNFCIFAVTCRKKKWET